jgi:UPF0755 protein
MSDSNRLPVDLDVAAGLADPEPRSRFRSRISPKSAKEHLQPERVPPPPARSRVARHPVVVFLNFLMTVVVVAVFGGVGLFFFGKVQFEGEGPLDQARTIVIQRGAGLSSIAEQLQRHGIIANRWVFAAGVRLSHNGGNLKAGEYLIPTHASMADIMDLMVGGRSILYSITIPEGLTSEQIVQRLRDDPVLVGDIAEVPAEGTLLPDTYKFSRGDTREAVLERMARERDRVVNEVWSRRVEGLPITSRLELVILASIVEKETGIADERSRVASVFINRLNRNMRLQSDPTVIYGIFGGAGKPADRAITRADLDRPTPYKTYLIDGLPPGPIANPGRASLEAVANPSRTNDLYFVADGTGGHAFAETYEEHLRNVARWRQVQARQAQEAAQAAVAATDSAGDAAPATPPAAAAFAEPDSSGGVDMDQFAPPEGSDADALPAD